MTRTPASAVDLAKAMLGSPRFSAALTTASIGAAVCSFSIRQTIGWAGLFGILGLLVALAIASLIAQWEEIGWRALLPISLLVFTGWAALSILWSWYQWATLGGLAYLAVFTVLAVYIALVRDTIQIVRAFGDVLRFVLVVSIALEIFSGLLIDAPIRFLGIQAHLAEGGPIQGLLGTRNQLGIVALIAAVTFGTELRTRSIRPDLAIGSLVLAAATMAFTRSPLIGGVIVVLGGAIVALYALRRVKPSRRTVAQLALLAAVAVAALVAWASRARIIELTNAGGELDFRLTLWQRMLTLIDLNPVEGWGWLGYWRAEISPFQAFGVSERVPVSGLNAYLDVWFQLGFVGVVIFVGLAGLADRKSTRLNSSHSAVSRMPSSA